MTASTSTARAARALPYAILALALALTVLGWREFWFLTDDAFIAFRYVRNAYDGHGLVWNRAPFAPVDGYTSFGWVALLELTWHVTGVAPPSSCNVLSLLLSLGTITLLWRWLWRLTEPLGGLSPRLALTALGLAGALSNRTFLAWTSSGLETAMYVFAVTAWLFAAWSPARHAKIVWAAAAALVALTRPDGIPMWAMTAGLLALAAVARRVPRLARFVPAALAARPAVMLVVATLPVLTFAVWRYATYRTLLPNTFYAKVTGGDPAAGGRYLASFVLEYALWAWALWVLAALVVLARRRKLPSLVGVGCTITLLFHIAYYAIVVGGDHFEYKTFAHLIPIVWVVACAAAVVLLGAASTRAKKAALWAALALVLAASLPVPWIHYAGTRNLTTRDETFRLRYAVAPHLPSFVRFYGTAFDRMQSYLIMRFYCMRHQEHKVFYEWKVKEIPDVGYEIPWKADDIPVMLVGEAGVVGWRLPGVAMLDGFGLNDRIVARNPHLRGEHRVGHERQPPPGYFEAFEANVSIVSKTVLISPRTQPLGAERVREIESRFEAWLKTQPRRPLRPKP